MAGETRDPAPSVATEAPNAPPAADEVANGTEPSISGARMETPPSSDVTPLPPVDTSAAEMPAGSDDILSMATDLSGPALEFLRDGGYTIWAIAALSVITVALILWKIWRLALIGAWSRGRARLALEQFEAGREAEAKAIVAGRRGLRSKVIHAALHARETFTEDAAREETTRVAKREIGSASRGLRPLELIATIAPLLGLLGTVLGMIAAFQALQDAGAKADPATLAGGIWEALLTTAAGMAVAIPASAALAWFEGIIDSMAADVEDGVTRIFIADRQLPEPEPTATALAAE